MPYDASNKRDVKALEKQAKLEEQQRRECINGIMSVAPGRKWMCELLEHCHIFATSFSDVGLRMAFMEGQREIGLLLLTDIMSACPTEYIRMMEERNARQSAIDAGLSRSRSDTNGGYRDQDADEDSGSDDTTDLDDYGDSVPGEPTR